MNDAEGKLRYAFQALSAQALHSEQPEFLNWGSEGGGSPGHVGPR